MLRVLIAEDEPLMAAMLRQQVEGHGHRVIARVASGDEAVRICRAEHPDLVLMDVQMPRQDGLVATRAVMADCPTCVIIITGRAELDQQAEQAGAMAYALKPLFADQLPSLIETARYRFDRFAALHQARNGKSGALQAWLLVRRAISALMESADATEQQAFAELDRLAAENAISVAEAAQQVLAGRQPLRV